MAPFSASSGETAPGIYAAHKPDVVTMDVTMRGIDGIEASRLILAEHPDAYVLAGSTEFGLAVNKRHERPAYIAYVGGIAEMKRIDETAADWRIGAAVPGAALGEHVAARRPAHAQHRAGVAHVHRHGAGVVDRRAQRFGQLGVAMPLRRGQELAGAVPQQADTIAVAAARYRR